jgi:hypothetical protein
MSKTINTFLCSVALLLLSVESGFACTCVEPSNIESFKLADAVFFGKAVNVGYFRSGTAFRVERAWKGVSISEVTVLTNPNVSSCGFRFEEGKSYVVYARKGSDGEYHTGSCTGTANVSSDGEQLAYLQGKATLPLTPGPMSYGKIGLTTALFVSLSLGFGFLLRMLIRILRAA